MGQRRSPVYFVFSAGRMTERGCLSPHPPTVRNLSTIFQVPVISNNFTIMTWSSILISDDPFNNELCLLFAVPPVMRLFQQLQKFLLKDWSQSLCSTLATHLDQYNFWGSLGERQFSRSTHPTLHHAKTRFQRNCTSALLLARIVKHNHL